METQTVSTTQIPLTTIFSYNNQPQATSSQIPPLPSSSNDVRINMNEVANSRTNKFCLIFLTILVLAMFSPFVILDLYIAYTDISCVNESVSRISFTLKTWLLVSGYVSIGMVGIILILSIYSICTSTGQKSILMNIFKKIFNLFSVAWNITGAVLFWGMMDYNSCNNFTRDYMYAKLILSFIFTCFTMCSKDKDSE